MVQSADAVHCLPDGSGAFTRLLASGISLSLLAAPATADVVAVAAGSFVTRDSTEVFSVPVAIHLAFSSGIATWWDPVWTIAGTGEGLSIDLRPDGCFCETVADGRPHRHLTVVEVDRGRRIVMSGALGALAGLDAEGRLTWTFTEGSGRTRIEVQYEVTGDPSDRLDELAPAIDAVLSEQLQRLKRFIESGRP
jgi:hypothetical protein